MTAELLAPHMPIVSIGLLSGIAAGKVEGDKPKEGSLPAVLFDAAVAALRSLMADSTCETAVRDAMTRLVPGAQETVQAALA